MERVVELWSSITTHASLFAWLGPDGKAVAGRASEDVFKMIEDVFRENRHISAFLVIHCLPLYSKADSSRDKDRSWVGAYEYA
jgi:hypothetical protein